MKRRGSTGWLATKLEVILDRAVELVGLEDPWHHPLCGTRWQPNTNHCRRYCRNQGSG